MLLSLTIILLIIILLFTFLRKPKFGKLPTGERLLKIQQSPNYKNGSFQNISHTPNLAEGVSNWSVMKEFFFEKKPRIRPKDTIPSVVTDLLSLDLNQNVLVWFGHSSYYMQIDGKRILVDPVFNGSASPLWFGTKAFKGTNYYTAHHIPEIDLEFIFLRKDNK